MKRAPGPHLPELLRRSLRFETRSLDLDPSLQERFGEVVRIRWPQEKHLLYDPQDFGIVLRDNAQLYRRGSRLGALLGKSIATSEGEHWRRQKRILGREFHQSEFSKYFPKVDALALGLVRSWNSRKEVSVSDEFMEFTFRVAAETLFGGKVGEVDVKTVRDAVGVLSDFAIRQVYAPINLPALVPTPAKLGAFHAALKVRRIIDRLIQDYRKTDATEDNVLARLVRGREENLLTDQELRSEAFTLLLAGHETTSNALTWCLYELARNPKYQDLAHTEIRKVLYGGELSLEKLEGLQWIDLILKEALRLYPPFPLLSRTANEDTSIKGYLIPKDSRVYCMTYLIHRSPRFWKDPESFRPERFTEELIPFTYLPFGGGTRKCLGADFAMLEMKLVLTRILERFTLSRNSPDVKPRALVTLVPGGEIRIALKPRPE